MGASSGTAGRPGYHDLGSRRSSCSATAAKVRELPAARLVRRLELEPLLQARDRLVLAAEVQQRGREVEVDECGVRVAAQRLAELPCRLLVEARLQERGAEIVVG